MVFSYKTVHLSEYPCYTLSRSGLIESPYIQVTQTRFVQPGKIEIDANERAAIGKRNAAFSFAPSSILSLTILYVRREKHGCSVETVCLLIHKG